MLVNLSFAKKTKYKIKIIFCDTTYAYTKYWLEIWQNNKKISFKNLTKKQYEDRKHKIKYKSLKRFYYDNTIGYAYQ